MTVGDDKREFQKESKEQGNKEGTQTEMEKERGREGDGLLEGRKKLET